MPGSDSSYASREAGEVFAVLHDVWDDLTAVNSPFEVETIEVSGQSLRAYKHAAASLAIVWDDAAMTSGEKDALIFDDECWTYAEADAQIGSISRWYRERGLRPGDRVGIAMRNYPEWMLAFGAAMSNGLGMKSCT